MIKKPYLIYETRIPQGTPAEWEGAKRRFDLAARGRAFNHIYHLVDFSKKRVLDVGCSYGEYLIYGGSQSVGVTLHPQEVRLGTMIGLSVIQGNAQKKDTIENIKRYGAFDIIYCVNLLEHMDSPHIFLRSLSFLAEEKTMLILGVPVFPMMSWLMRMKKFNGSLAMEHINFFTHKTLQETLRRAGWRITTARPFIVKCAWLDRLMYWFAPQQYILAQKIPAFAYPERRKAEVDDFSRYYF
ncbi:MAG: methyltransferase domain-containing protein [bacterium]|nr:methyltransferase domain-containing protein [bacterium]